MIQPPSDQNLRADSVSPALPAAGPPVIGGLPPTLPTESNRPSSPWRQLIAVLLNLCLGLFLADAVVSLADDSLILFFGLHLFAALRAVTSILALLMAIVIYGLMGLTPMIPKRFFLPIALFPFIAQLAFLPLAIYFYDRLQQVAWVFSCSQVSLGLWVFHRVRGGLKFRWLPVTDDQLTGRGFSWRNLSLFVLVNVFVLPPAVVVYLVLCTAVAVDHFSDGFMALRPGGLTVQVRKYVRDDGKVIELFPMAHVADAGFYQQVSQTFPSNSIILMEGVTDEHNLLTNKITYKRMAKSLGLAEQHEKFEPVRGEMVRADVDIDRFSRDTIDFLNLVMLVHSKGVNAGTMQKLMQYSPPPHFEEKLFGDLVGKRNQHLLEEIQSHLSQSDNIMVPWGVAHMPGIAKEIQKTGFHLDETREYTVIRFR